MRFMDVKVFVQEREVACDWRISTAGAIWTCHKRRGSKLSSLAQELRHWDFILVAVAVVTAASQRSRRVSHVVT